ncbi:MAG: DUF2922 domain-containing protein [Bacillota bacterium]
MITKRLEMIFQNTDGRRVTIAVPDPKVDLTQAETQAAMDAILAKNVFTSPGGDLVAAIGARVVTREVADVIVV